MDKPELRKALAPVSFDDISTEQCEEQRAVWGFSEDDLEFGFALARRDAGPETGNGFAQQRGLSSELLLAIFS